MQEAQTKMEVKLSISCLVKHHLKLELRKLLDGRRWSINLADDRAITGKLTFFAAVVKTDDCQGH